MASISHAVWGVLVNDGITSRPTMLYGLHDRVWNIDAVKKVAKLTFPSRLQEIDADLLEVRATIDGAALEEDTVPPESAQQMVTPLYIVGPCSVTTSGSSSSGGGGGCGDGGGGGYGYGAAPSKRPKLKTTAHLLAQHPLNTLGTVVDVVQKDLAGFASNSSLIFVREESVALWGALEDAAMNGINVSVGGPPGTGKSTEAWAWALWTAATKKIMVTWFHFSKLDAVSVLIDGGTGTIISKDSATVNDIADSEGVLLVVDGVTQHEFVDINRACCQWRRRDEEHRRFVTVSSVSVVVAEEQIAEAKMVLFTVSSWTFEQYETACSNQQFYESVEHNMRCPGFEEVVDRKELLISKYFFAGGSARWMFDFDYELWQSDFTKHLQKVSNYEIIYFQGSGDETQAAVNHLRGATALMVDGCPKTKYFFISQHASRELGKKCNDKRKFIIDGYKMAAETKNPAFGGWIFEFDVDYQLQSAYMNTAAFQMQVRSPQEGSTERIEEQRHVTRYVEFASVDILVGVIEQLRVDGGVVCAKPVLWCQKAYDFLFFWIQGENLNMVAANASHAKEHSVLLNIVNTLAAFLGVHRIRFDFLVPSGSDFQVGNVIGRLCEWKNLEGIQWPHEPDAAPYLSGSFIVVAEVTQTE